MSTQLWEKTIEGRTISLTSFSGGKMRGPCIQITVQEPTGATYVQLERKYVLKLVGKLFTWLWNTVPNHHHDADS